MGLHLYCVTPERCLPHGRGGLEDERVEALVIDGLAVWFSRHVAPPQPGLESARRHHDVVAAAMAEATPVPLRFGQWLADEEAVRTRAAARVADWRRQLDELAGSAEYGLRILDPQAAPAARDVRPAVAGSGRAYLEALAARRAERESRTAHGRALVAQLEAALGDRLRRARVDPLETPHGLVSAAFLVRRDADEAFRAAIDRAAAGHPALRFLTSGPWPPWSFAT